MHNKHKILRQIFVIALCGMLSETAWGAEAEQYALQTQTFAQKFNLLLPTVMLFQSRLPQDNKDIVSYAFPSENGRWHVRLNCTHNRTEMSSDCLTWKPYKETAPQKQRLIYNLFRHDNGIYYRGSRPQSGKDNNFEEWNRGEKKWQPVTNARDLRQSPIDTRNVSAEKIDSIIATRAQNKLLNAALAISGVITVAALKLTQNNR